MMLKSLDEQHANDTIAMLSADEGYRQFPYKDINGFLTAGFGRCLSARGISKDEAMLMLQNDLQESEAELMKNYHPYNLLDATRKSVLLQLCFNLGFVGLMHFRKMLAAIEVGDFKLAAQELLDSEAAKQLDKRYHKLAGLLEHG